VVFAAGRLLGERERLVWRRRQEKDAGVRLVEQALGQFGGFGARTEESLEPLELVEHHEIRFERLDARARKESAKTDDEFGRFRLLVLAEAGPPAYLFDQFERGASKLRAIEVVEECTSDR